MKKSKVLKIQPGVNNLLIKSSHQSSRQVHKKEKLTASKFYIAVAKKVELAQKL